MSLLKRKKPFVALQYEGIPDDYTEEGVERGAKLRDHLTANKDLADIYEATRTLRLNSWYFWLDEHKDGFDDTTFVVNTDDGEAMAGLRDFRPELIINTLSLNEIRHLNTFLGRANEALVDGGYIWCHSRTARLKREIIYANHPGITGKLIYHAHYLWHRVCPKLRLTKWLYFAITRGQNRTYHRVEILGRMYRAGFEVVDERFSHGEFYVIGRKFRAPIWDDEPTCGPLVKLLRVGYKGELIGVYKFRTMYSYSEYLQPYMLEHEGLMSGGKFAHDYRVNGWGKLLRRCWLDELPMVINLLKGQIKLVGVRPLSRHYFSLYSPEMQALRIKVKPGLLPPFYYEKETPKTLDDVQASERRYIEAYLARPFATDWRYFWGTVGNIIFKHKRSH